MQSRKRLIVTLMIGLGIFLVSLIMGRPWWQALFLSIAFLLVSTVLMSSGLLIPEGLFGRKHSDNPKEVTTKESVNKKMDLLLADLSTQPGTTTEDVQWLTEYTQRMKEVCDLVYAVHESVRSKDRVKELRALREVAKELPPLISQFKDMPELAIPERQNAIEQQIQGLDLYLEACSDFAEAIDRSDGELAIRAAKQINEAIKLLDIMDKSQLM